MRLSEAYKWEAELEDGTIITKGGNLTNAIRFSLIPQKLGLPRHDWFGVRMERRFGSGFISVFSGVLKEYTQCVVMPKCRVYVRYSDGGIIVTPKDYQLNL